MKILHIAIFSLIFAFSGCKTNSLQPIVQNNIEFSEKQTKNLIVEMEKSGKILSPRTVENGKNRYTSFQDWTSGFFPGSLWYLYELTGKEEWKTQAVRYTEALEKIQFFTAHHDIGFMMYCSYGNGLRLTQKEAYKPILIQSAKSLLTRYRPGAGIIQSWNANSKNDWKCPVIIDNMMNLELLFEATQMSGDSSFYQVAISHADNTLKNHYRPDMSCYHVLDYDPKTGAIRHKNTAQGYQHESAWARGQAWGLYGFTMCYRYTHDKRYLEQAEKIAAFLFSHPHMPKDLIPYWDFDVPTIPNAPRDASAAAIIASALYELSTYAKQGKKYQNWADQILKSLSSSDYLAQFGENGNFLLMHSVGSIPHKTEIDVPLVYADYYFLEAMKRKLDLSKK